MSSRQTEQRKGELSQFIFECEIKRKGNKRSHNGQKKILISADCFDGISRAK